MPRRILLFLTDLQLGGTPTVVRELAIRLHAPPGVIVEVGCLAPRGPVADALEAAGISVFPMNARGTRDWGAIARFARLVRERRYDTVFSFLVHANTAAAAVASFLPGVRFIQSIQTTQPFPRWHWTAQRLAAHAAERIVVPSPSVALAAEQWSDVPRGRIVVIPNAIEPAEFAQPGDVNSNPCDVGFIGRLDPVKRVPDLVRAVRLLNGRVHLHVFGEGPERSEIERTAAELNVSDQITMHGAISGPAAALRRIGLLVLPSIAEGFGLVLIEAMAAGVPVIATDVPGIRDVVRRDRTGLLVPPRSPEALAAAIRRILDDPDLRSRLIAEGARDVRRRFTWDAVLPQYRALLELEPAAGES